MGQDFLKEVLSVYEDSNAVLKLKIESLEAQLELATKAALALIEAAPVVAAFVKENPIVVQDPNIKIDTWVGRSHIKNPA